jgi:hypothetical protein
LAASITPSKRRGGIRKKKLDEGLADSALFLLENGDLQVTKDEEERGRKIAEEALNDTKSM